MKIGTQMATPDDFGKYYSTVSNTELLSILGNPGDYQPLAVEAAKKEFEKRQLSEAEIEEASLLLIAKHEKQERVNEKLKSVEINLKKAGLSFIDHINPLQLQLSSRERTIRFLIVIFGSIILYQFIAEFKLYLFFIQDFPRYPIESTIIVLPLILLLVGLIKFWKRKSAGWLLLIVYSSFSVMEALWLMFLSYTFTPSALPGIDGLFEQPTMFTYFTYLLFYVAITYVMCRKNIRDVYNIDSRKMLVTISATIMVAFFLMLVIS